MRIKILTLTFLCLLTAGLAASEPSSNETFKGIVLDAQSNEPIPYASISLTDASQVTRTNDKGNFNLVVKVFNPSKTKIKVSCVGYKSVTLPLSLTNRELKVTLTSEARELGNVEVKKNKYRNKNNPAVELIEKVIANKKKNRMEAIDYYDTQKYEKILLALNNITPEMQKKKIFKHFQFVFENIDSLETGKKILPIYLKERISDYYYRKSPKAEKEVIKADKKVNFDENFIDNRGLEDNIKYMYQDINIYDNNITFVTNQFLSPIAPTAPSFYRFYIMDTVQVAGKPCAKMFFGSRNKEDMLFQGYLYVMLDGSYAIKKVELTTSKNMNINWLTDVKVVQEFDNIADKGWMLSSDITAMNFGLTKNSKGVYGQRKVVYKHYGFDPAAADTIFKGPSTVMLDSAKIRNDEYWKSHRLEELTKSEANTYSVIDSVQHVPVFKRTMDIATMLLFGYKNMGKYEIGPVNTFYSYNPVEGVRLRFGGRTLPAFSKRLYLETYAAYGFKDERMKYYLGGTWSFSNKSIYEFPVKSLKMSYQDETQIPGQELRFVQEDNVLLSIKRGVNDKLFYNRTFKIEHLNEFENHFSYTLGYQFLNQRPGGDLCFNYKDYGLHTNDVNSINTSEVHINFRYAPHEVFYQTKAFRYPIVSKYPVIEFQANLGSKAIGGDYNYQNLKLTVTKRFYLSVLGYSDVVWEAGKIFGKVPYPLLDIHHANQTYSYQILSYNLMNFLEFASDQYTSLNIDHCFNGFILNKIPIIKHLNLRESITCKVLWGGVSDQNNPYKQNDVFKFPEYPDGTPVTYTLEKVPYIEGSVGIGNIFRFFRVDLVKRFTYLHNPNVAEYGIRARFKFDF